jgi:hypothetical protein
MFAIEMLKNEIGPELREKLPLPPYIVRQFPNDLGHNPFHVLIKILVWLLDVAADWNQCARHD